MTSARALIALLVIAVVTSSCGGPGQATQASQPLPANLGVIDFPTSGSPEAQEHVLRGAAMLHSFGLEDAALEFRQAQELDPDFAMAYWGEAMSYNHPLQRVQQWDLPKDALMRLGPDREARLAKAPTEREQGFVAAVDSVFFGERPRKATAAWPTPTRWSVWRTGTRTSSTVRSCSTSNGRPMPPRSSSARCVECPT